LHSFFLTFLAFKSSAKEPVSVKQDWQKEWETLQVDARKEGHINITCSTPPVVRSALMTALRDKFGIDAEFVVARSSETAQKLAVERRAGLCTRDVIIAGSSALITDIKPSGFLDSLDPVIFLPEVLDPKSWFGGELPWVDKDHQQFAFISVI
jgi:hypothetical protein